MGSAEHVESAMAGQRPRDELEMGSAEHVELFCAAVVAVKVCRGVRNSTIVKFRSKTSIWRKANSAELASVHSKVDEAFDLAAELRVGIHLESLTPRVQDKQWQPLSTLELQRKKSANVHSAASASGRSTPSDRQQSTASAMKKLDSRSKTSVAPVLTPEDIERRKAARVLTDQ